MKLIYKNKLFVKYCVVGGTAAAVDFSILFILTDFLNVYYLISATISFIVSALTNYSLNRSWTFRSNGKKRKQLPIFFTIATIGLILNNSIMYFSVEVLAVWYIWAKVVATGIVLIWNFIGNKYLTFNKKFNEKFYNSPFEKGG
ncbi:MAG: GtrA family protein [Patescibacteria group bacterium]|nr:GtrA family protein [Patescibacteria group bacterium]